MNYNKKSVEDIDVKGKRVLCRCDFNVPTKEGKITSDKRIVAAMPTIEYLVNHGARVILCSHMGKPKGEWKPELSLQVVADRLSELLGKPVVMAKDVVGEDAKAKAAALKDGDVMLLENVRFMKDETKNDPELSKELASLAEIFVNDAFGTAHRAHSSTAGVADYLPAVCGFLVEKEVSIMGKALADPTRPFVAILGGAKVSDKLNVINNLLDKAGCVGRRRRGPGGETARAQDIRELGGDRGDHGGDLRPARGRRYLPMPPDGAGHRAQNRFRACDLHRHRRLPQSRQARVVLRPGAAQPPVGNLDLLGDGIAPRQQEAEEPAHILM